MPKAPQVWCLDLQGEGNAGGPQGDVRDALQGLVAKKVLDMIEFAAGKGVKLEVSFGRGTTPNGFAC